MYSVPATGHGRSSPEALVLDRKVVLVGGITYEGEIVLAGRVEGEVRCQKLSIAERGSVDGDIVADKVVVMGEVAGVIYANELVLKTACNVTGQIFHKVLHLEDGSFFEGQSRRHGSPLLAAPASDWPEAEKSLEREPASLGA
jgi:cytoskeletal protein CcmA (bactofilin family)